MHAPKTSRIPVDLLLRAYRGGVFPMADHRRDTEVYWVEPRERAILPLDGFRLSKSLKKMLPPEQMPSLMELTYNDVFLSSLLTSFELHWIVNVSS